MKQFNNRQKIMVVNQDQQEDDLRQTLIGKTGVVTRLRIKDNGAWVHMDEPLPDALRVFPANDESGRGDHILLYPDECEPAMSKPQEFRAG